MRKCVFCCALLALISGPSAVFAGFDVTITGTATKQAGGSYLYSYTLTALATSTVSISEFDIAVNDPIGISSIVSPSDFYTFYNPGDSVLTFDAFDSGIAPGSSGVFSFISSSGPGLVSDLVRGLDSSTFMTDDSSGMIIGASSAVPEPASVLMCGIGAVASIGLFARSRKRRAA